MPELILNRSSVEIDHRTDRVFKLLSSLRTIHFLSFLFMWSNNFLLFNNLFLYLKY